MLHIPHISFFLSDFKNYVYNSLIAVGDNYLAYSQVNTIEIFQIKREPRMQFTHFWTLEYRLSNPQEKVKLLYKFHKDWLVVYVTTEHVFKSSHYISVNYFRC